MMSVAELETQPRKSVIAQYESSVGNPPPRYLSLSVMAQVIVYEEQASLHGRLPARAIRQLRSVIDEKQTIKPTVTLNRNARLVREWNGVSHVVDRVEGGFSYRGKTYRSLSAVAKDITGTKWSGPRFFGLAGAA